MSASGRARSMKAWRLDRNTRNRWSRRISIDAGWMHFGSNGSIPMRPASIAARMSRSERTTSTEYAGLRRAQPAHRTAELAPGADGPVGVGQRRSREPPEDLDGVRTRGPTHREIGGAVTDHDGLIRGYAETAHGVPRQIRRGLRTRGRIPAEVDVDVLLDAEPAKDPFAVGGALARDRRLQQPGGVEILERPPRAAVQARRRDRHLVISTAVFDAITIDIGRSDVRPREPEHRVERKPGELAHPLVRKRRTVVRRDHRVHRLDDEAHAVGERAVQIPEDRADARRFFSGGDGARARPRPAPRWGARSARRRGDRAPPGGSARGTRARRRARRCP